MHQSIMNPLNPRVNGRIWFLYPILYIDHVVKRINFKCKFHCYGYDQQMSMYNLCTMGIITGSLACVRTVKYKYATVCVDHSAVQQLNLSTQFTDTINAMVNCQLTIWTYSCGLFAVAFAAEVINGSSPIGVRFAVRQMRNHLMKCLLDRELSVFPRQRV